jgi:hypothetical protein
MDEMNGRTYRLKTMLSLEQDMVAQLNGHSYSTESHFRRVGLPILSGLLDDSFNEPAWIEYVGSAHIPLDIYSEEDKSVLFTLPPLMYIGPSLINQNEMPSLTEETTQLMLQGGGANVMTDEAVGQLIVQTVEGIDQAAYADNVIRAKHTIDTVNGIFDYYQVRGRVAYPEGLLDAFNVVSKKSEGETLKDKETVAAKPAQSFAFDDGEEL